MPESTSQTSGARSIVLTGGGTAGHVMPNLALAPMLEGLGYRVFYVGSRGMERQLVASVPSIEFRQIAAGKLRRYFSFENLTDVFKVCLGTLQSLWHLVRIRPAVIFSKGGFVSVPVAVAGWILRIPVVTHESDLTPGLANRIIGKLASRILLSFQESERFVTKSSSLWVGTPIRRELFQGNAERGRTLCGFADLSRPILLITGGSSGAERVNQAVRESLEKLIEKFDVIHLTGVGKAFDFQHLSYKSFEFVGPELPDLFAAADVVVSRAGANAIFELLALRKPMLLIPLMVGSRGDQVDNAQSFASRGWAQVLMEDQLTATTLLSAIDHLWQHREDMTASQGQFDVTDAAGRICEVIDREAKG